VYHSGKVVDWISAVPVSAQGFKNGKRARIPNVAWLEDRYPPSFVQTFFSNKSTDQVLKMTENDEILPGLPLGPVLGLVQEKRVRDQGPPRKRTAQKAEVDKNDNSADGNGDDDADGDGDAEESSSSDDDAADDSSASSDVPAPAVVVRAAKTNKHSPSKKQAVAVDAGKKPERAAAPPSSSVLSENTLVGLNKREELLYKTALKTYDNQAVTLMQYAERNAHMLLKDDENTKKTRAEMEKDIEPLCKEARTVKEWAAYFAEIDAEQKAGAVPSISATQFYVCAMTGRLVALKMQEHHDEIMSVTQNNVVAEQHKLQNAEKALDDVRTELQKTKDKLEGELAGHSIADGLSSLNSSDADAAADDAKKQMNGVAIVAHTTHKKQKKQQVNTSVGTSGSGCYAAPVPLSSLSTVTASAANVLQSVVVVAPNEPVAQKRVLHCM
jgi:hypothetical protein